MQVKQKCGFARTLLAWSGFVSMMLVTACGSGGGGSDYFMMITSTAPTEATVMQPYNYQILSNALGSSVFEVLVGPTGMTVDLDGLVEWTPQLSDLGTHDVDLKLTCGIFEFVQSFDLRVHQDLLLGVTLSPRGHTLGSTSQDFIDHYSMHEPWGSIIAFHSPWRDSVASAGQMPTTALAGVAAAQTYGITPAIGLGWTDGDGTPDLTSQSDPVTNSWLNVETRSEFVSMVTNFATTYEPPYLFLGNETNSYWLICTPTEWNAWISVFEECYTAIKNVSPDTMVYTVFVYEKLKGLGQNAGWSDPSHMSLLDDHVSSGLIDAIGFTTYPYLEYDMLGDVPSDYYDDISTYWTGPVIFTEIGWLSAPSGSYPGDLTEQAAFVAAFLNQVSNLDVEYATWLFLHDWDQQATVPSVAGIGFRNNTGTVIRPVDAAWQAAVLLRER